MKGDLRRRSNDHFDFLGAKGFDEVGRGSAIRDDGINAVETTKRRDRLATKFGGVETEDHFLGSLYHGALNINEQAVRVGDAFKRDATSTHDGNVGMDF